MKNARELLEDVFKESWRDAEVMVSMFTEDGALEEVMLVDVEVVRFLTGCEQRGIELLRCPAYIRHWMTSEGGTP